MSEKSKVAVLSELQDRKPAYALAGEVDLVATGGVRTDADFAKAMEAIGCLGMRACSTDSCPVGIATQKENLRKRLKAAKRLQNFFEAPTQLMGVLARICTYDHLSKFTVSDLST